MVNLDYIHKPFTDVNSTPKNTVLRVVPKAVSIGVRAEKQTEGVSNDVLSAKVLIFRVATVQVTTLRTVVSFVVRHLLVITIVPFSDKEDYIDKALISAVATIEEIGEKTRRQNQVRTRFRTIRPSPTISIEDDY